MDIVLTELRQSFTADWIKNVSTSLGLTDSTGSLDVNLATVRGTGVLTYHLVCSRSE